jgi:glycosyltransferase involved in cell wall biosynthesis
VTTFGIAMVRDEADIIAGTLRHMADEVDYVLVADNGSGDGTREILIQLQRELPLRWVDDPDVAYYQSRKMTALAARAAELGATWIVPFDADELWLAPGGRIRDVLAETDADIADAVLYDHLATALDLHGDVPQMTMQWRRPEPAALPKVAFRWRPGAVIHQGNHGVDLPDDPVRKALLEVRHFPARSARQWARKGVQGGAAYAAAPDLPEAMGTHWRQYAQLAAAHGVEVLHEVFRQHWWYLSPVDAGLVHDPAPFMRWRSDGEQA